MILEQTMVGPFVGLRKQGTHAPVWVFAPDDMFNNLPVEVRHFIGWHSELDLLTGSRHVILTDATFSVPFAAGESPDSDRKAWIVSCSDVAKMSDTLRLMNEISEEELGHRKTWDRVGSRR
jgi:hypothetical protein